MDDTFVFPLNLYRTLADLDHSKPLYVGDVAFFEYPAAADVGGRGGGWGSGDWSGDQSGDSGAIGGTSDGDSGGGSDGVDSSPENNNKNDAQGVVVVVPVAFGGCGWGLSSSALKWALKHKHIWNWIVSNATNPQVQN
jgi:hypothetical protein